jgi:hypothetical protein
MLKDEFRQADEMAGVKADTRFHFMQVGEFCSGPMLSNWIIKGILSSEALAVLFGETGSMKSFVALDMGLSIARGFSHWQGHPIKKQGAVFYIAGEGKPGLRARAKVWGQHHEVDLKIIPFHISDRQAKFLDDQTEVPAAVDELQEATGEDPVLIVIDTLARNFGSGDENKTEDMSKFVAIATDLMNKYHCSILIIHHSGLTNTERARGAVALKAAADWEYRLEKNDELRKLTCTKSKDYEAPAPMFFRPDTLAVDGLFDEDGDPITSIVLTKTDAAGATQKPLRGAQKVAYEALEAVVDREGAVVPESGGELAVDIKSWRAEAFMKGVSSSDDGETKRRAFRRAVDGLRDAGRVDTYNDWWWATRQTRH